MQGSLWWCPQRLMCLLRSLNRHQLSGSARNYLAIFFDTSVMHFGKFKRMAVTKRKCAISCVLICWRRSLTLCDFYKSADLHTRFYYVVLVLNTENAPSFLGKNCTHFTITNNEARKIKWKVLHYCTLLHYANGLKLWKIRKKIQMGCSLFLFVGERLALIIM